MDDASLANQIQTTGEIMKKFTKITAIVLVVLTLTLLFAACGPDYSELAGTYEVSTLSGEVNGVTINKSSYEYFRIILTANGKATVESKGAGGGVAYTATGTFTYADGKINVTTRNGSASATETYDYENGKIHYKVDTAATKLDILFVKTEEKAK